MYADTLYALGYGNGYAAAQDRLFEMDVLRRAAKGTLAELVGEGALGADISARNEMYSEAERLQQWLAMPPEAQELWLGYQDGVNRWIAELALAPLDRIPIESAALAMPPVPWVVTDSVAIAHLQLDRFGVAGGNEMGNARLLHDLVGLMGSPRAAEAAFNDMAWDHDPGSMPTIAERDGTWTDLEPLPARIPQAQWDLVEAATRAVGVGASDDEVGELFRDLGLPVKWGSNAALLAQQRSASGGAMLWGGPQVGYAIPGYFWEVGLHGAGFDITGVIVPGNPGVVIGRTAKATWSVTSGIGDQVDVFAARLHPDDDTRYWHQGDWRAMECRDETFLAKQPPLDAADAPEEAQPPKAVVVELCRTVHGPVIWWAKDDRMAFAKGKAHRDLEIPSGVDWIWLGTLDQEADPLAAFQGRLAHFAHSFNFHYADVDGHILYMHAGRWPLTAPGFDARLPVPGDGSADWAGVLETQGLPRVVDPAQGYVVNWNNLPMRGVPTGDERGGWGTLHRVELLDHAMRGALRANGGTLNLEQFQDVMRHAATHDPYAPAFAPMMLRAAASSDDAQHHAAARALAAWQRDGFPWLDADGDEAYDHQGHAVWDAWMRHLVEATFRDQLGPRTPGVNFDPAKGGDQHAAHHGTAFHPFNVLLRALQDANAALPPRIDWLDDATTPAREGARDVLLAALGDAIAELEARFGTADVAQWREPVHTTRFDGLGAASPPTMAMTNRGSFNQFMDFGTDTSVNVVPPGQSGHVGIAEALGLPGAAPSPHVKDQMALYEAFAYKPLRFHEADVRGAMVDETTLVVPPGVPAGGR